MRPLFAFFPHAVGTANLRDVEDRMPATPAYVTEAPVRRRFRGTGGGAARGARLGQRPRRAFLLPSAPAKTHILCA